MTSKSRQPQVTIVTPAHNCADYLRETYASIKAQQVLDWEWRVVDDASDDSTPVILAEIARSDERVIVERLPQNAGAAVSRNRAMETAQGRFVAFLDADDLWYPGKLSAQIEHMHATGVALSYGDYDIMDDAGKKVGRVTVPAQVDYKTLLNGNVIGCLTAMYDRDICGDIQMPLLRKRQDFGLWLQLLKAFGPAQAYAGVHACYRRRSGSLSANKLTAAAATWKIYREVEHLSIAQSASHFSRYATNGLVKRIFG